MKRVFKIIGLVVLTLFVSLFTFNQLVKRNLETSMIINSSPEKIWETLMDYEDYPDWNPFIKSISGTPEVGEQLDVNLGQGDNEPMNFKPKVLVNQENEEFRWRGVFLIRGIFDGEHYFRLERIGENQTRFTQGEHFTGILSGLMMNLIGEDTEKGFNEMNAALKMRVENQESNLSMY